MKRILPCLAIVAVVMCSCSSVEQISKAAGSVRTLADSSRKRFDDISGETKKPEPDIPLIGNLAVGGSAEQTKIIAETDRIHNNIPGVTDTHPYRAVVLMGLATLLLGGVIYVLTRTQVLSLVSLGVSWIVDLFPHKAVTMANERKNKRKETKTK